MDFLKTLIANKLLRHFLHPSVLFCCANIFAFAQGNSTRHDIPPELSVAIITFLFVLVLRGFEYRGNKNPFALWPWLNAMAVLATGALLSGLFSFASGHVLAGFAGLFFAVGNYLNAFPLFLHIQHDARASPAMKALTHAAVYYGLGYACIGLMAGGFETFLSGLTTGTGIGVTLLSTYGLVLGKFTTPAAPFIAVALGTGINTLSGLITGNMLGAINNFLPMLGELGLAYLFHKDTKAVDKNDGTGTNETGLWQVVSRLLEKPADFLVRNFS